MFPNCDDFYDLIREIGLNYIDQPDHKVLERALQLKFEHSIDSSLRRKLIETGDKYLCYYSPGKDPDLEWGCKLKKTKDGYKLVGENLIGVYLMKIRERVRKSFKEESPTFSSKNLIQFTKLNPIDLQTIVIVLKQKLNDLIQTSIYLQEYFEVVPEGLSYITTIIEPVVKVAIKGIMQIDHIDSIDPSDPALLPDVIPTVDNQKEEGKEGQIFVAEPGGKKGKRVWVNYYYKLLVKEPTDNMVDERNYACDKEKKRCSRLFFSEDALLIYWSYLCHVGSPMSLRALSPTPMSIIKQFEGECGRELGKPCPSSSLSHPLKSCLLSGILRVSRYLRRGYGDDNLTIEKINSSVKVLIVIPNVNREIIEQTEKIMRMVEGEEITFNSLEEKRMMEPYDFISDMVKNLIKNDTRVIGYLAIIVSTAFNMMKNLSEGVKKGVECRLKLLQ